MKSKIIILKPGDKSRIAGWLGLKKSFFSKIINKEKPRPGPELALRLHKKTGISCENWFSLNHNLLFEKIFKAWKADTGETKNGNKKFNSSLYQ